MQSYDNEIFKECLLTRQQAAEFLGVKEHTLAVWACSKRYNLPYVKIGRLVKYRYSDLLAFVEQQLQHIELPEEFEI